MLIGSLGRGPADGVMGRAAEWQRLLGQPASQNSPAAASVQLRVAAVTPHRPASLRGRLLVTHLQSQSLPGVSASAG